VIDDDDDDVDEDDDDDEDGILSVDVASLCIVVDADDFVHENLVRVTSGA